MLMGCPENKATEQRRPEWCGWNFPLGFTPFWLCIDDGSSDGLDVSVDIVACLDLAALARLGRLAAVDAPVLAIAAAARKLEFGLDLDGAAVQATKCHGTGHVRIRRKGALQDAAQGASLIFEASAWLDAHAVHHRCYHKFFVPGPLNLGQDFLDRIRLNAKAR